MPVLIPLLPMRVAAQLPDNQPRTAQHLTPLVHCLSMAQPHTLRCACCPWRVLQAGLNCPVKLGVATILYNLVPQLLLTSFYVLGSIASCHGECHASHATQPATAATRIREQACHAFQAG